MCVLCVRVCVLFVSRIQLRVNCVCNASSVFRAPALCRCACACMRTCELVNMQYL